MAYFKNQPTLKIIDKALTASYDDTSYTGFVEALSSFTVYIKYTPTDPTSSLQMLLEFGPDIANLYPEGSLLDTDTTGVSQIKLHTYNMAAGPSGIEIKRRLIFDVADKEVRISFKETTSNGFGSLSILMTRNEQ